MRIGLVAYHTSPAAMPGQGDSGGLNVLVAQSAWALTARGHDVTVVTRANHETPPGTTNMPRLDGVSAHRVGDPPRLHSIEAGTPHLLKLDLLETLDEFSRGLSAAGPFDILHSHYWLSGMAAAEVSSALGVPHVTTFHTVAAQKNLHLGPGEEPEPEVRLNGERSLTQSAVVVASSQSELRGIIDGYGTPRFTPHVISPGVDTNLFRPRFRHSDLRRVGNRLRITVLGRVQPLKGQDLAVRAVESLARIDPDLFQQIELVIAGEATAGAENYAAELRRIADQVTGTATTATPPPTPPAHGTPLSAPSRGGAIVTFLPAQTREATAELLATSHLVLVPSMSETFGLVALEAAAAGTPVVAFHTTGLLESVSPGVSGIHVDSREPEAWARAISCLLLDEDHHRALSQSAREFAHRHDWSHHASALEQLYLELVAG